MLRSSVVGRRDPPGEIRPSAHAQPSGRWGGLSLRVPSLRHRLPIDRIARWLAGCPRTTGSSSRSIGPYRRLRDGEDRRDRLGQLPNRYEWWERSPAAAHPTSLRSGRW